MKLADVIRLCEYRIHGGNQYLWNCYSDDDDTWNLDFTDRDGTDVASVVFDRNTQEVFEVTVVVPGYDQAFVWRNPAYEASYLQECKLRNVDPNKAWDNVFYQPVDETTMASYLQDIIGTYYDNLPIPGEVNV